MLKSEVVENVKKTIIEVVGIEEGETIELSSKLINDLGAESIDFLDIMARLERRFDITLDTSGEEVENAIREMVSEEELETGALPPEVIAKLPELIPEIDASEFKEGMHLNDIPLLFSVNSMTTLVINALKEQKEVIVEDDLREVTA